MNTNKLVSWLIITLAVIFFIGPLLGTFEFSLRMVRGVRSFEAYRVVFMETPFVYAFSRSVLLALFTIVIGVLIIVPTIYLLHLRLGAVRPLIEFVTLLPLVIPAIVIAQGYLRSFGSASLLPMLDNPFSTDALIVLGYVTLAMPYMFRSVDAAMRAIDVKTLTEASQSLGAGPLTIITRVILPNVRSGILGGAFIAFAIVIGEFIFGSLLSRPVFATYMQNIGANKAYEPAALAIISFLLTWVCIGVIQFAGRGPQTRAKR